MAVRKPLVITNGQIEQLQAGDILANPSIISRTNNNAGSLVFGTPVKVDGAGGIDKAQANSLTDSKVLGLVADASIATTAVGNVQIDTVIEGTTGDWDAVTGQVGGLTAGATYWLDSATAGKLTSTAPSASGEVVARVGLAISATELELEVGQTIRL